MNVKKPPPVSSYDDVDDEMCVQSRRKSSLLIAHPHTRHKTKEPNNKDTHVHTPID